MPGANGAAAEAATSELASATPAAATPAPSHQVRVLRPTVAALNAGIRPGERAPSPVVTPPVTPRERGERSTRVRERTPLSRTERMGTPGETLTPQTTYIHRRMPVAGALVAHLLAAGAKRKERAVALIKATSFHRRKHSHLKTALPAGSRTLFPARSNRCAWLKAQP